MFNFFKKKAQGVGFNLRLEAIDQILNLKPKVQYLEVITDNWLEDGPHHQKLLKLRESYELLFHCVGMNVAGVDPLDEDYLKEISSLVKKFEPIHVSDHLCFQGLKGVFYHDLLPFPLTTESFKNVSSRTHKIQEFLGQSLVLENLSYYVEYNSSLIPESIFLNDLANLTGCGILLDLNNIWVNQANLNIQATEYIDQIDFKNVKEIHLAGAEKADETYVDTHGMPISEEVLQLLQSIRNKTEGIPVIFEKDTNINSLKDFTSQAKRIHKVIE